MTTQQQEVLAVLHDIRARLTKGWCQYVSARDATGASIGVTDPSAVCWCISGAYVATVSRGDVWALLTTTMRSMAPEYLDLVAYNDAPGRTQAEMLALVDVAIALAGPSVVE